MEYKGNHGNQDMILKFRLYYISINHLPNLSSPTGDDSTFGFKMNFYFLQILKPHSSHVCSAPPWLSVYIFLNCLSLIPHDLMIHLLDLRFSHYL